MAQSPSLRLPALIDRRQCSVPTFVARMRLAGTSISLKRADLFKNFSVLSYGGSVATQIQDT